MASNVSISITAETADLQAKLALAQSNLRAFTAETKVAADALRDAGDSAGNDLKAGLETAAASMASARVEVSALRGELSEAGGARGFGGLREQIEAVGAPMRNFTGLITAAGEAIGAAFIGERVLGGIEKTAELGESLLKLSKETGISVETLSGWHYAADQVGVSAEALDTGLVRLGRNIQTAVTTPTSAAARAFQAAGISQQFLRANSNDTEAVMRRLAQAFHDHAGGAQADAIAQATLSRSGAELIAFLQEGPAALDAMTAHQKALGDQMTTGLAEAFDKHRRAVKDLGAAWDGFVLVLTDKVAPALTATARALTNALAGASADTAIAAAEAKLDGLKAKLVELQTPSSGPETIIAKWFDAKQITYIQSQIDRTTRGLEALRQKAGEEAATAPKQAGPGFTPDQKPAFGSFDQPTSQLEQFRAKLEEVKAKMAEVGASTHDVLAKEVDMWRQETAAAGLSAQEQLQISRSLSQARIALAHSDADAAGKSSEKDARDLAREMNEELRQRVSLITSAQSASDAYYGRLAADVRLAAANREISGSEEVSKLASLDADKYSMQMQALQEELSLYHEGETEYGHILDEMKSKTQSYYTTLDTQAMQNAAKEAEQAQQTFNKMMQPLDQFVSAFVSGHATMAQAAEQMWVGFADTAVENILKAAAQEALYTALHKTLGKSQQLTDAETAFGNTYSSVSAIPYVGWILAPAAASAAFAAVMAFDAGTPNVPSDMLAQVHAGEGIIPATFMDSVRSGNLSISGPGGGMTGGGNATLNVTIQAWDTQTGAAAFGRDISTYARMLQAHIFTNPSTSPQS